MPNEGSTRALKTVRIKKGVKPYTYLGCPMTRNRSAWCFRLCPPDAHGNGRCGRVAPHSLKGRTQLAIEAYNRRRFIEALERLAKSRPSASAGDS
jgi:hypothetical protein